MTKKVFTQAEADQLTQEDIDGFVANDIEIEIVKDEIEADVQEPEIEVVEEKPKVRFNALPGFVMVGYPGFPFETDDEEKIEFLKGSRAMRANKVWIDSRTKEEAEAAEQALGVLSFLQLKKMVASLGHIDVHKYSKLELLDILQKEGM